MADSYTAPPTSQPVPAPYGATTTTQPTQPAYVAPASKSSDVSDLCLYILAIFIPPVPVAIKRGIGADFCINILLWILGWIPGVIHAWYIISKPSSVV